MKRGTFLRLGPPRLRLVPRQPGKVRLSVFVYELSSGPASRSDWWGLAIRCEQAPCLGSASRIDADGGGGPQLLGSLPTWGGG